MFKYPGHGIAIWTILFIVAGSYVSVDTLVAGKIGLGFLFLMLPVGCALLWLDIRPAKWLIVAYLVIAVLGVILSMVADGFTLMRLGRAVLAALAAFQFATWDGNPEQTSRT